MWQKANQCWKLKKDQDSLQFRLFEFCVDEVFQQALLLKNAKGQNEGQKDDPQKTN